MNQGDIGMASQLEQLLLRALIHIVKIADDKQCTTGFGDTSCIGQHVLQAVCLLRLAIG